MGADQSRNENYGRSTNPGPATPFRQVSQLVNQEEARRILQRQQEIYDARCRNLRHEQGQNLQHQVQNNDKFSSERLERDRRPYSYNQNNLPTQNASTRNIYPNLNNTNNLPTQNASTSNIYPNLNNTNPTGSLITTERHEPFVVNNATPQSFRSHAPPSAPPPAPPIPERRVPVGARPRAGSANNQFNCPVCSCSFGLKIFQCQSGHSVCENCRTKLANCQKCRSPMTDVRNRALEALMAEIVEPCYNWQDGCKLSFKLCEMESHLSECPFGEIPCPLAAVYGRCAWKGKLSHLESHFTDVHPEHRQANIDTEMNLVNICDDHKMIYLVTLGSYNFLVAIKVSKIDYKIYMTTQLIGTQHSAEKWEYEFHVYNKSQPRRKFVYTDICSSTNNTFDQVFKESHCVSLPLSYAMTYVNEGCLTYKFFIKKNDEALQLDKPKWNGPRKFRGRSRYRNANC